MYSPCSHCRHVGHAWLELTFEAAAAVDAAEDAAVDAFATTAAPVAPAVDAAVDAFATTASPSLTTTKSCTVLLRRMGGR